MSQPLYRRLLGTDFDRLPPLVRRLHDLEVPSVWEGRADVERGGALICRLIAAIGRLPPTGPDQPLTVTFTPIEGIETWHRSFGGHVFRSRQSLGPGVVHERIGLARLSLVARVPPEGLTLSLDRLHVLGVPVPRVWTPSVATREYEAGGRYRFEVEVTLPLLGRLVRYAGWLEPVRPPVAARDTL